MKTLNYKKLLALKPTLLDTIINGEGQEIKFYEHPTEGDLSQVIIVYDAEKLAVLSDFFECDDMVVPESDYQPIYMHGVMNMAFEIGYQFKK